MNTRAYDVLTLLLVVLMLVCLGLAFRGLRQMLGERRAHREWMRHMDQLETRSVHTGAGRAPAVHRPAEVRR